MTVLALEFRPARFADVVGQRHIVPILRSMVRAKEVPPSLLFGGSRGTGKTSTARILAAALNCERSGDGDACAECEPCRSVASVNALAVLEVDAASNGLVEDVRKIKEMVSYEVAGFWRVVMLDEAHSMSRPAFNALLKVLEEPPAQTTFVLLTTEVGRIPDTVASRSMTFKFRRLTLADIEGRLAEIAEAKAIETSPGLLNAIALYSEGGLRDAVMTLDQCSKVGISTTEGFRDLFGLQDIAFDLISAASEGDYAEGARLIDDYFYRVGDAQGMVRDLIDLVTDLIITKQKGQASRADRQPRAEALAERLSLARLSQVAHVLWDLKSRTRAVDNDQRAMMELAFVLITSTLCPEQVAEPIQQQEAEEQPLRLADMVEMAKEYQEGRV
jgi:DNA polymerase-3 subunit gamma/tau